LSGPGRVVNVVDLPVPRRCKASNDAGRGLQLVEDLAEEWGVETIAGGKSVWFEVDLALRERLRSR